MLIQRMGPDGVMRERDLNITEEQYNIWLNAKDTLDETNVYVDDKELFKDLSEEDLIFFRTGLTKAEMDRLSNEQHNRRSRYLKPSEL